MNNITFHIFADDFISFDMIISDKIKEKVRNTPDGVILTVADFGIEAEYQQALVMALSRMVRSGELEKVSKGKYYKPKKTVFGQLGPSQSEVAKDFLMKGDKIVGYVTGTAAFASMGLTTQISSSLLIGTSKYRRSVKRGDTTISFIVQPNTITKENIPLLRLLDAIKLIREIPATTPDKAIGLISRSISALSPSERKKIAELSAEYTAYVRALLGAILENIGAEESIVSEVRSTLNGTTNYKLPLSESALPTKRNWNIL